ncbi:hypothetical protein DN593_28220 [Klebsiella pneumoniae]|nr:hypothetical protein DN593_28220 [Klebsiella pneumoniae]
MKGKRKLKSSKWAAIELYKREAQRVCKNPSHNQLRFLEAAHHLGIEHEPCGAMTEVSSVRYIAKLSKSVARRFSLRDKPYRG